MITNNVKASSQCNSIREDEEKVFHWLYKPVAAAANNNINLYAFEVYSSTLCSASK